MISFVCLAVFGPPLVVIVSKWIRDVPPTLNTLLPLAGMLWALLALVVALVVFVERLPLTSIGLRVPRWHTIVLGLLLALVLSFVVWPTLTLVVRSAGLPANDPSSGTLLSLPVWFRIFVALTAGVVEETLYRGYAVERLASLTGNYWFGGTIAAIAFGLAHIPSRGIGPSLVVLGAGATATAFYIWRRDLLANIIAHVTGNIIALVFLPLSSHRT